MENQMNMQQRFEKMPETLREIEEKKKRDSETDHLIPKRMELSDMELTSEELADGMSRLRLGK